MLVLTRKKNESIVIDDVIRVMVVEIRGDKVRLGIEAPREIEVHRQEVYDVIHRPRTELVLDVPAPAGGALPVEPTHGEGGVPLSSPPQS